MQVSGLTPDTTYNVLVGTTTVGSFTTGTTGRGHLSVSNIPATVTANSTTVTVETSTGTPVTVLSGTFAAPAAHTRLSASLTGATGTSGEARYSTNTTAGTNEFSVQVSGLTPDTTYNVVVGTTTETFTTDAKGRGHLSVSNFPGTVTANTMVTVETSTGTPVTVLSGTFAADTGFYGQRHHGWHDWPWAG